MSADPETGSAALPLSLERQLNAACDRFEAAWRAGTRPRIEDFLTDCPGPGRGALLAEMLALELAYRARAGEVPAPEEYRTRFPAHEAAIRAAFRAPAPAAEHAARGAAPTRRSAGAAARPWPGKRCPCRLDPTPPAPRSREPPAARPPRRRRGVGRGGSRTMPRRPAAGSAPPRRHRASRQRARRARWRVPARRRPRG